MRSDMLKPTADKFAYYVSVVTCLKPSVGTFFAVQAN